MGFVSFVKGKLYYASFHLLRNLYLENSSYCERELGVLHNIHNPKKEFTSVPWNPRYHESVVYMYYIKHVPYNIRPKVGQHTTKATLWGYIRCWLFYGYCRLFTATVGPLAIFSQNTSGLYDIV